MLNALAGAELAIVTPIAGTTRDKVQETIQINGVPPQDLEPVLLIECPRFLFPFARRVIGDVTSDGGFPPFLLDPIDFAGVYAAPKAQGALDASTGEGTIGQA